MIRPFLQQEMLVFVNLKLFYTSYEIKFHLITIDTALEHHFEWHIFFNNFTFDLLNEKQTQIKHNQVNIQLYYITLNVLKNVYNINVLIDRN